MEKLLGLKSYQAISAELKKYIDMIENKIDSNSNSLFAHIHTAARLLTATATAEGWSDEAPYTQTISVSGITASDTPIISLNLAPDTTAANEKAIKKAYSCLSSAVTNDGSLTLYCASKKPTTNFTIFIKGA